MALNFFQLLDLKKGFSLPLWVAAAAKSAVKKLIGQSIDDFELIKIPNENKIIKIKVHSVGFINGESSALAISFAQSGLDLDLTQNLEIWALASLETNNDFSQVKTNRINIIAGDGVGIYKNTSNICISNFAKEVIYENLLEFIPESSHLKLEIIFPKGKLLAERTSNKSFDIVGGLSIIGTSAETHSSASPDQLKNAEYQLEKIANNTSDTIVFVIGENGLDLVKSFNLKFPIIKVGNWIGPLLVDAAIKNFKTVILFGYHGKLIKLAGGIFHTHNHLADARIEILVYLAVLEKLPNEIINRISLSSTIEQAFLIVEDFSFSLANKLWIKFSNSVEIRSMEYVNKYVNTEMKVAAIIFDRKRQIRCLGTNGKDYIAHFKST